MEDQAIDRKQIDDLLRIARAHAIKRGYANDAYDFAQEAYIARARGRQASIEQLFVDYLRKYYGDIRTPRGFFGSFEKHGRYSLDQPIGGDDVRNPIRASAIVSSEERTPDCEEPTWAGRIILEGRNAKHVGEVFDLVFSEGMSRTEVADLLGVTPSRVSQVIREVKKRTKAALTLDELWDVYTDDPQASVLFVDWITI